MGRPNPSQSPGDDEIRWAAEKLRAARRLRRHRKGLVVAVILLLLGSALWALIRGVWGLG